MTDRGMIISVSRALQEREVSKQMRNEGTTFDHNLVPRAFRSFLREKPWGRGRFAQQLVLSC